MAKVSWVRKTPLASDEDAIIQEGLLIKSKMTGNTNFGGTDTVALLATFTTALTAYQAAKTAADKGGTDLTAAKVVAKATYSGALYSLGSNVNSLVKVLSTTVDNKNAILETSGFPLSGTNHTAQPLPKPENLRAKYPAAGILEVLFNTIQNANTITFNYREHVADGLPVLPWKEVPKQEDRKFSRILTAADENAPISRGKQYDFQVVAIGALGVRNESDIFTTDYVR